MADFSQTYEDAGRQYNIDPALLQAMARVESGERTNDDSGKLLTSTAGAQGWMQFIPDTAKQYGVDVSSPTSSIFGAAHYMSDLLDHTGGDLSAALALYNGSLGDQSQTYAKQILSAYKTGQAERQVASRASGATSEKQPTPGVIEVTASGKPPAPPQPNASGRTSTAGAPDDFGADLYSKRATASAPPPKAAPPPAPSDDFSSALYGPAATPAGAVPVAPQPPAPAAIPAIVPPAEAAPVRPPQGVPPPTPAPSAASPLVPPAVAAQPPAALSAPGWFERNIGAPVHSMMDPVAPQPPQNYLLNVPLLQEAGAGIVQGTRDVAQTIRGLGDYADARIPALAALDRYARSPDAPALLRWLGGSPESSTLPAQTEAFNKQYGSDIPAQVSRIGSELLTTYPVGWAARGAGSLAEGAPYVGRFAAPVVTGTTGGGLQNLAVSEGTGQDPLRAAETGAVGGGIMSGALGMLGRLFSRVAHPADAAIADRLGIRLSRGQLAPSNSVARRLEDTTAVVPGSGAARFADEQRQGITRMIAREAGIVGPVEHIDTAGLNAAEGNAGQLIENAAQRITVPGTQLTPPLVQTLNAARQAGPGTQQAYTSRNLVTQLLNLLNTHGGSLPGSEFAGFIRRGGPLDTALNSSVPEVRAVGRSIREALFNAAATSGTAAQDAIQDMQRGRYQWKVIQTVRPAIARTAAGTDEMSLPMLAQNIRNEFDMRRTGAGADMQDLSRLISGPLRALPSSGTAERSLWQALLGFTGVGGSAGLATYLGHPQAAEALLAGTAGPAAASVLASRASRFGPGLGIDALEAARQELNPLAPRLFGPWAGRNTLLPQQQTAP